MDENTVFFSEGRQREALAAYFLSVPPYREQSPEQQQEYRRRLRQLGELECRQVLAAAGSSRPLTYGDPVPLLQGLFTAAQRLAAGMGQPLMIFPARETALHFPALLHPRLLCMAGALLLRAACTAAPKQPVWVHIREQADRLTVSATAAGPWRDKTAAGVIEECAKLHGGNLAHSDHSIAFSCGRVTQPPPAVYPYSGGSVDGLYDEPLSPLWSCFYAWLDGSSVSASDGVSPSGSGAFNESSDQPTTSPSTPKAPSAIDTNEV